MPGVADPPHRWTPSNAAATCSRTGRYISPTTAPNTASLLRIGVECAERGPALRVMPMIDSWNRRCAELALRRVEQPRSVFSPRAVRGALPSLAHGKNISKPATVFRPQFPPIPPR